MPQQLETLIAQLTAKRDLAAPQRDAQGRYFLLLDGELEISLLQHADRVVIEGRLGPLPGEPARAEVLLARALRTRFARFKRRREVLSIDPESGELVLFLDVPAPTLELPDLERAIAGLAGSLEFWHQQLSSDHRPVVSSPALQVLYP